MFRIKNTAENQKTILAVMHDNEGVILNKEILDDYITFNILNHDPMFAARFSDGIIIRSWLNIVEAV